MSRVYKMEELLEEIIRVVGARTRLRMVLDREDGKMFVFETFDAFVVEVDVGNIEAVGETVFVHGKAMVLGCNFDFAGD